MNEKRKMQDTSKKPETMKGGEKEMKKLIVISMLMACVGSAFAVGGILADGQGTNQAYGVLNMRDQAILNADGQGITNIPAAGVVGTALVTAAIGDTVQAHDAGLDTLALDNGVNLTNIPAAGVTGTALVTAAIGDTVQAYSVNLDKLALNDGGSLTNLTPAALTNSIVDGNGIVDFTFDGSAGATVVVETDGATIEVGASGIKVGDGQIGIIQLDTTATDARYIGTNATGQTKAGALTIEGVFTASDNVVLVPSSVQTLATDANVADDAAITKVAGDGGAVTVGMDDGATEGQLLTICGTSDANTVQLTNAAVVPNFMLGDGDLISFTWTGSAWLEQYRRDN